jgi:protein O-GlcNAc transferase
MSKKIISFSLWGDKPLYWVGAKINIELAKKYYPGWICRFYIDENCDKELIDNIKDDNVEIFLLKNKDNNISNIERFNHSGLYWRFLPLKEEYDVLIFRDCDSRISEREVIAVDEWLLSDKDYHIMRDHPYHSVPILSGMWGCKKDSLNNIDELLLIWSNYQKKGVYAADDQDFLGQLVYPIIRNNTLEHSEFGINYGSVIKPFPTKRKNYEFVGDVFDINNERHPEFWKIIINYENR